MATTRRRARPLLVDGTGLKRCGAMQFGSVRFGRSWSRFRSPGEWNISEGEWLAEQHGTGTGRGRRKSHRGVDADTGPIVAASRTARDVDDSAPPGPSLDQVDDPVASFTADGARDQDGVHGGVCVRHPNAAVIVPPRCSAVPGGRDRPHTARPVSAAHRRVLPHRLVEGIRHQLACAGRG
jgi:hypothetical protein